MSAAPELRAHLSHIKTFLLTSGHYLHHIFHRAQGEKHPAGLHIHETRGQSGKITHIVIHAGAGQSQGHAAQVVQLRTFQQIIESLQLFLRQIVPDQPRNQSEIHALSQQPGCGVKILRRG